MKYFNFASNRPFHVHDDFNEKATVQFTFRRGPPRGLHAFGLAFYQLISNQLLSTEQQNPASSASAPAPSGIQQIKPIRPLLRACPIPLYGYGKNGLSIPSFIPLNAAAAVPYDCGTIYNSSIPGARVIPPSDVHPDPANLYFLTCRKTPEDSMQNP